MKKLEDIPKNNVFEVPEGYFDRLPGVIQARVAEAKPEPIWSPWVKYGLKYALPVMAIVVAAFFFRNAGSPSTEDLIASVDSADLVAYLGDTDISSDDLLETISLDNLEAEAIQNNSMEGITGSDAAMDSLTNEFGPDYF
jgi:hypothetical protein